MTPLPDLNSAGDERSNDLPYVAAGGTHLALFREGPARTGSRKPVRRVQPDRAPSPKILFCAQLYVLRIGSPHPTPYRRRASLAKW